MITAVDTNIILDVLNPAAKWSSESKILIDDALSMGAVIICGAVYAELASFFEDIGDLDKFLSETRIKLVHSSSKALEFASSAWKEYLKKRREGVECSSCGRHQMVQCAGCGATIRVRQHIITDFLIGGHALALADVLLTRDKGYYKTYFPSLKVNP